MSSEAAFSPAKINLYLAVTGRRTDGFHDLVSLVAPLDWGDRLEVEASAGFSLVCNDPAVPLDESNLILKAARQFVSATGWKGGARFRLEKRIPMGAGLGGGSSNAATALRLLNRLAGGALDEACLRALAAQIGSDCPLFLHGGPVILRGRGERIEPGPATVAARLRGQRLVLFKPSFGVSTPWAYGCLAAQAEQARGAPYTKAAEAEARLARWMADPHAGLQDLLFNQFEGVVFDKYPALPVLLDEIRALGFPAGMSGSGSACFALIPAGRSADEVRPLVVEAWGEAALFVGTQIA